MERRDESAFTEALEAELTRLYEELPPVSCTSCGKCCSSPHITFVEAMRLFEWLFQNRPAGDVRALFDAPPVEQAWRFNYKCRFEDAETKLCGVHPARGFVCRVFGYPVLDRMGVAHMDNCREPDRPVIPNVRVSRMQRWLDRLADLNRAIAPDFGRGPYHVTGLNIETWLDIAVTDYGRPPFSVYHCEFQRLPFAAVDLVFSDRTGLSTRLAKIDLFHQARRHGQRLTERRILENLTVSEPLTGTFFRYDAGRYLQDELPRRAVA